MLVVLGNKPVQTSLEKQQSGTERSFICTVILTQFLMTVTVKICRSMGFVVVLYALWFFRSETNVFVADGSATKVSQSGFFGGAFY